MPEAAPPRSLGEEVGGVRTARGVEAGWPCLRAPHTMDSSL